MLTYLAAVVPPRVGHLVARLLGISAAQAMWCACGCGTAELWDELTAAFEDAS